MRAFKVACVAREGHGMPEWVRSTIDAAGVEFVERDCGTSEQVVELAADADVVWVMGGSKLVDTDVLPRLERCGAIIRSGSGTDNIPVAEATGRGIIVANTPDATAIPVAEHAIALLLSLVRQIPVHDRLMRDGVWSPFDPMPSTLLHSRTIGLIGFGRIARCVAERLLPFAMNVLAFDPMVDEAVMEKLGVQAVSLALLLAESDFVSIHTPLVEATHHLIGEAELRGMKPTSVLVNTSRGSVVDTKALAVALREGWIAAAGLDVLESEPPADDDPLIGLPNVVITPHIAAIHEGLLDDFWRLSVETVIDLSQKKWPLSYVNPEVKPRWKMTER